MIHRIKRNMTSIRTNGSVSAESLNAGRVRRTVSSGETKEETGLTLSDYRLRGVLTFVYNDDDEEMEYIFLYTADGFAGSSRNAMRERWSGSRKRRSTA